MYLSQIVNVNLTEENADILKRPSKLFNKLKSVFSGEMTPTQRLRAEVMLSVLQRVNIALRRCEFTDLVSVIANSDLIYEDAEGRNKDLQVSEKAVIDGLHKTEIKQLDSLSLSVDGCKGGIRFLINVNIQRKAAKQSTPVKIQLFGFIEEFRQLPEESATDFSARVKQEIATKWGDESSQKQQLDKLEAVFSSHVAALQAEIDTLFPAHSELEDGKKVLRRDTMKSLHKCHHERYSDTFAYLPIWLLFMEDAHGEAYYDAHEDFTYDNNQAWDDSSRFVVGADSTSWADNVSDSNFGGGASDSGDSGASCGGGCGGGCGGA